LILQTQQRQHLRAPDGNWHQPYRTLGGSNHDDYLLFTAQARITTIPSGILQHDLMVVAWMGLSASFCLVLGSVLVTATDHANLETLCKQVSSSM
jgi:hypothetical protein